MKSWIIIGILIALMSSAALFYYNSTQNKIELLTANNATLAANNLAITNANKQNIKTIDDLRILNQKRQEDFLQVESEFQTERLHNSELKDRLDSHELGALAAAKPGLVEKTVNIASANSMRCFELLSGAPLNENERAAKTDRQFNSECPWLFLELKK